MRTVTDLLTDHLQKRFPKIDAIVGKCLTLVCFCNFSKWAVPDNIDTLSTEGIGLEFLWGVVDCKTKKCEKIYEI